MKPNFKEFAACGASRPIVRAAATTTPRMRMKHACPNIEVSVVVATGTWEDASASAAAQRLKIDERIGPKLTVNH
eukprot:CAMPEP_0197591150 /NCGR_PEP_ID=MMETSP1326-20131121/12905_1 /TAXON_ID=1155430 /ORGANISM="Genus nov. species nov., Strain RCC2288" /LENGTH=74 /DNA_ID=CAMNT_0043156521 /DNA_START=247 /DNA_END=469 /DNA_ORIENTATION=+